jgi:protein-tyrosine phosphatase
MTHARRDTLKMGLIFAGLCAAFALAAWTAVTAWLSLLFGAAAVSAGIVGVAYLANQPCLLMKHRDGRQRVLAWLLLWPYFGLSHLSLVFFRRSKRQAPYHRIRPQLFLGCRLSASDAPGLRNLGIDTILDLTAEFSEAAPLRSLRQYKCIRLLDTASPTVAQLREGIAFLEIARRDGRGTYVHCAAGHGRSATYVLAFLLRHDPNLTLDRALEEVRGIRPGVRLTRGQREILEVFVAEERDSAASPRCSTCGAAWGSSAWTLDCPECGGGDLQVPCPVCHGDCGEIWRRAVIDSNDERLAHWLGHCGKSKG